MIDEGAELVIRTADAGAYVLVQVVGDLDLESAPALTEELRARIGPRPIVLDLAGIEFMDSSGLGVLVGAHKDSTAQGGALLIAAPGPRVHRIFKITKLHKVFALYETVDEAVRSIAGTPVQAVVPGFEAGS
ncbi:STAS domain-containing protein [Kribbella sp. NPDC004875]|uniref:STAS domain-containing protein n=1 Tax=Kribbella sp. NPDC004875 TaxID=3364107 RepID=UPI0036B3416F